MGTLINIQKDKHKPAVTLFIYLSIFINSYIFFKEPFEFYFGYIIYILLLPGFFSRYGINRQLFMIFFILLLSGIINILLDNNTFYLFFKVFTGLLMSYFFYFYVILDYDYNVDQLFKWYLKGCYIASLLGIFQFISFQLNFYYGYTFGEIFNKWGVATGGIFGIRINSIFAEPTHLGAVLSAAFFVSVYNIYRRETYGLTRLQSIVVIIVYLLSFSGLGQAGVFVTLLLLAISFGLIRYVILVVPLGIVLFTVLYENVTDFRDRLDGLVSLFSGNKFELGKTHGSSFVLYNNYHTAIENFKSHFVFGTGIGSHPVAFDKFSMAKDFKVSGFNSNSADANSMFLRLVSETGLFGVLLIIFVIFRFYVRRNENHETYHWLVSNSILVMILLNLFRQGHYFLNGFPFFVILYVYNYFSYQSVLDKGKDLYQITVEEELADSEENVTVKA